MVFGLELGRPEVTLKTRSVTGSVTLIPAALPLSASRDSETLQVRRVLLLIVLNCDLCSCLFTLSHYLGAVRLACNLCLLYVKFGWLILCILLVIWVENFGKYFQVFDFRAVAKSADQGQWLVTRWSRFMKFEVSNISFVLLSNCEYS